MEPSQENIPRATLPKSERLCGRTAVDTLFREGNSGFVYPFRYIYTYSVPEESAERPQASVRILFSVPKRYHKRANKRNLLKRRARESYRQGKTPLTATANTKKGRLHIALIYSSKEVEPYARINNAILRIISEVQGRI